MANIHHVVFAKRLTTGKRIAGFTTNHSAGFVKNTDTWKKFVVLKKIIRPTLLKKMKGTIIFSMLAKLHQKKKMTLGT